MHTTELPEYGLERLAIDLAGEMSISRIERKIKEFVKPTLEKARREGEQADRERAVIAGTLAMGKNHQNYDEFIKSLSIGQNGGEKGINGS